MAAEDRVHRTRLSTKGRIVAPRAVRERLNWAPGVELVVGETDEGVVLKRAKPFPPSRIEDVAGCLHRPGMKAVSIKEMNEGIVAEAKRRHARGWY
jgi:AbrB family looped-hinge helix DNA binding protein